MLSLFFCFQSKASKRKQILDEAYGQQGFLADSRDLVKIFTLLTLLKCIKFHLQQSEIELYSR